MSKHIHVDFSVSKKLVFGVACFALGGILHTAGASFADNMTSTSSVTNGDFVLPYDGFLMLDSVALNGSVRLKFELYESLTGSTVEWSEEQTVNVYNGRFSAGLGSINSVNAAILDAEKLWLAITIVEDDGMGGTVEVPLSGRQAIEPAPYAAWSANAADLNVDGNADIAGRADVHGALFARDAVTLGDDAADIITLNGETTINNGPILNGTTTINGKATVNGDATITGDVRHPGLKPAYANWNFAGEGDGGAGIVNDNGTFDALMIVGNTAEPGLSVKKVELFDDVEVHRNLDVNGRINVDDGIIQRGGATITNATDLGLYSRVAGNWMRFVTNGAPFVWFDDDGIGTQQDMSLTNGNLAVRGNVTVGGKIVGLTDSGVRELNSNSDVSLGINVADGMCFLTKVRFDHNERDPDALRCEVYPSNGVWRMANSENSGNTARGNADCKAHCILF